MTDIFLPKIGFAMTEGTLSEWMISDGGAVEKGQPLFCFESDKSVQEVEAPASGVLQIIAPVGTLCEVGTLLGKIV
jgi:pyruvate/2-oxoglutarate dehydrogenase complex dihydrolipoamide acyltransferase (E2) component